MFAVIEVGSHQFKVSEGDMIEADRLDAKEDKSVKLDKVLVFAKGNDIRIGQPYLKDVKVEAKVVEHHADRKVIALKHKKRKNMLRKKGHRQKLTKLNITKIEA